MIFKCYGNMVRKFVGVKSGVGCVGNRVFFCGGNYVVNCWNWVI